MYPAHLKLLNIDLLLFSINSLLQEFHNSNLGFQLLPELGHQVVHVSQVPDDDDERHQEQHFQDQDHEIKVSLLVPRNDG